MPATFRATVQQNGRTATGIPVPPEVLDALGSGRRPAVRATLNGYTYRSSVGSMGGVFMLPVSAEVREQAGVAAGDELEVHLELDSEPRAVVLPDDFRAALDREPAARKFFDGLSYSNQRRLVIPIEEAKAAETRQRRIERTVDRLRDGKA
jgi:bifunctional DNA-binding transcriptional regulator/antitoxin component of YhaV-PrlF toxin-antitoxin module